MTLDEARKIVLELAEQNVIDDPEMDDEAEEQREAIELVRASFDKYTVVEVSGGVVQEVYADHGNVALLDWDNDEPKMSKFNTAPLAMMPEDTAQKYNELSD